MIKLTEKDRVFSGYEVMSEKTGSACEVVDCDNVSCDKCPLEGLGEGSYSEQDIVFYLEKSIK
jgi:hypothetical protein